MDKIIPTLTIKPTKPKKPKKINIKLNFLNKPEIIIKPKTKGRGPDKQLRKLKESQLIKNKNFTMDEINKRKNNKKQIINDLEADDEYYNKLLLKPKALKTKLPKVNVNNKIQNIMDDKYYKQNQENKFNKKLINNEILYTDMSKKILNNVINKLYPDL